MNGDALFIENSRFRVVDGPYELRDVLDNGSLFGLVQFCCPEFLEPNNRMFFVYIRTNSASAGLKRKHVHKKATRLCCGPKPLTLESTDSVDSMPDFIDASISLKSLAQFNQKFASQKCTNKFPRGKLSSDQLNGCNILLEVSLTLFCVSRSTPNDNMFREIFLSNEAYHNRLITSLHEPLHLLFPNATRFQLLVIDILFYAMRNLNSQKKALKFDEEKFHEFLAVIRSTMLECAPVFLDRTNSAGCIVIYFALLQKMCQKLNKIIDLSSFTKALQKFGSLMSQKPGNNLNNELSERYRLNGRPFDLELFDFPHKALVWSSRMQKSSSYAGITSQGGTSLTNFVDILEEDETCWLNFLDLEQENNDVLPPVHPFQAKSVSSRIDIGREHLYGLLDVEPLSFELFSASDNVYVEDVKTREHLPILNRGRTSPIADDIISQVGSGTVKLRNFTFRKQAFSEITPEKFEQNHEANTLENSTDLCTLLPSSNSMPATPKTTPYAMTPGPSSPFHMTPPTQTVFVQESTLQDNFEDISKANKKLSEVSSNRFASEFLAPPSPKTVILERMTSLARRFVIMDFGQPILLTDILIPQSADLDSVSIDVWFLASNANLDTENNQPKLKRLVDSDEISHKSLSVCNLRPPVLCQYLRITYVGRCGLAPCISKVSIGSFFGLTCLPPVYGDSLDSEESHATKNASIIKSLRIFAQSLLYRYDSSCERLKAMLQNRQRICDELVILSTLQLVDITSYQTTLRKTYDECMLLKIQYNFVRRAIERLLDDDMGARKGGHTLKVGDFDCYTFADCSYDKLRFLCECLFTFCIRNAFFNNLQLYVSEHYASKHENDDYIAVICAMFNDFCCNGSPK
uniref:Uncharacterized protein n=1 Tax=Romanomermis culicivorax TaxID=13658 RepID=A0A915KDX2_ROMCU